MYDITPKIKECKMNFDGTRYTKEELHIRCKSCYYYLKNCFLKKYIKNK